MLTDEEIELGGYRFEDLQEKRIVENRTDLLRKQTDLGFPLPIKTGASQAMFLKSEVHAWLRRRAALRDAKILHNAENPVALPRPVGRPKTVPVPQRANDTPPVPRRSPVPQQPMLDAPPGVPDPHRSPVNIRNRTAARVAAK